MGKKTPKIFLAVAFLAVFLAVGHFYAQVRWINADEGAHLSDVQLLSEGLVPFVDFQSREPVYVYTLFLGSKIVGHSIFAMRLVPYTFFLIDGFLIYLLVTGFFEKRMGLWAGLLYLLYPFSFVFSVLIKTEPFGIFFTLLAFLFWMKYHSSKRKLFAFAVGIFGLLAFYARLADVATFSALFLLWGILSLSDKKFIPGWITFLLTYLGGVAVVLAGYAQAVPISKVFFSNLNPFFLFLKPFLKRLPLTTLHSLGLEKLPVVKQDFSRTMIELTRIVDMNLFLLLAGMMVFLIVVYKIVKKKEVDVPLVTLVVWAGTFMIFYGFYLFQRGVYSQYFTEILPPLIILFLVLIQWIHRHITWKVPSRIFFLLPVLFLVMFGLLQHHVLPYPNRFLYVWVGGVFLTGLILLFHRGLLWRNVLWGEGCLILVGLLFFLTQQTSWLAWAPKKGLLLIYLGILVGGVGFILRAARIYSFRNFVLFLAAIFLISGIAISGAVSGIFLSSNRYDCTWSPETVRRVTTLLASDDSNDSVMSGAMIWSYEAQKHPFMNITHPLKYNAGFPAKEKEKIEAYFVKHPPKYMIEDGYLRRNFFKYIPLIRKAAQNEYRRIASVENVTVYMRIAPIQ